MGGTSPFNHLAARLRIGPYEVKVHLQGFADSTRRITLVIDTDRTVIEVIHSETNMQAHAARALEVLSARKPQT